MPIKYPHNITIKSEFKELTTAIENGQINLIKSLIKPQDIDLSLTVEFRTTALRFAIACEQVEVVAMLLKDYSPSEDDLPKLISELEMAYCSSLFIQRPKCENISKVFKELISSKQHSKNPKEAKNALLATLALGRLSLLLSILHPFHPIHYSSAQKWFHKAKEISHKQNIKFEDSDTQFLILFSQHVPTINNNGIEQILHRISLFKSGPHLDPEKSSVYLTYLSKIKDLPLESLYAQHLSSSPQNQKTSEMIMGLQYLYGLENTPKNNYYAVKAFENAATQDKTLASIAYAQSFIARCYIAQTNILDQSNVIADMQATVQSIVTHYPPDEAERKESILVLLFDLMQKANTEDQVILMNYILTFFHVEATLKHPSSRLLFFILGNLKFIAQEVLVKIFTSDKFNFGKDIIFSIQDDETCDLYIELIELMSQIVLTQYKENDIQSTHLLRQLYKYLGFLNKDEIALEAYKKAIIFGEKSCILPAIKISQTFDRLLEDTIQLYEVAVTSYDKEHPTIIDIHQLYSMINAFSEKTYLPQAKADAVNELKEITKQFILDLQSQPARLAISTSSQLIENNSTKQSDALERDENIILLAILNKYPSKKALLSKEQTRKLSNELRIKLKVFKSKKAKLYALKIFDELAMHACKENWYHHTTEKMAVSNYLPALIQLMTSYIDRPAWRRWLSNSVRRNIFICAKIIMLSMNAEATAKRFDLDTSVILAASAKAKEYLNKEGKENTKYPHIAQWVTSLIESQKDLSQSEEIILSPDLLILNTALANSKTMHKDVIYGMLGIAKSFTENTLVDSLTKVSIWFPSSVDLIQWKKIDTAFDNLKTVSTIAIPEQTSLEQSDLNQLQVSVYPKLNTQEAILQEGASSLERSPYLQIGKELIAVAKPQANTTQADILNLLYFEEKQNLAASTQRDSITTNPISDDAMFLTQYQRLFDIPKSALVSSKTNVKKIESTIPSEIKKTKRKPVFMLS